MNKMSDYAKGLLDAQITANEHVERAHHEGRIQARDALTALSTDLLRMRQQESEARA